MKTPKFWKKRNLLSDLLLPFSWIYGAATALRIKMGKPYIADCPVICVGNLTAGGTGKTPVSLSIAKIVQDMGKNPFFITRGYGGKLKNIIVNSKIHTAVESGDEPLLLAASAPTAVNPDRAAAARLACSSGADMLIMDDGFQNPGLYKNLSFLVFDGSYGIGNGRTIPAGPLRESLVKGIQRAQAVIILGEDKVEIAEKIKSVATSQIRLFYGKTTAIPPKTKDRAILAFAGIGHPEKFYQSLSDCGLTIAQQVDFPDHHFYRREELQNLIDKARNENLDLYTTSKDYVKIPVDLRHQFHVLEVKIEWQNQLEFANFLKNFVNEKQ